MDINLKVSPAELEAKATDFKGVMSQIKTLTDDMMADVTGLSSTWTEMHLLHILVNSKNCRQIWIPWDA